MIKLTRFQSNTSHEALAELHGRTVYINEKLILSVETVFPYTVRSAADLNLPLKEKPREKATQITYAFGVGEEPFSETVQESVEEVLRRSANPAQVTDANVDTALDIYEGEDKTYGIGELDHKRRLMRRALTAAIGAGGQAVRVKPLEWKWDAHTSQWWANGVVGQYHAWEIAGHAYFRAGAFSTEKAGSTVAEAKAAAQADHERRILSALSQPQPADERVVEAQWREIETNHLLKGRRRSPAYFPATGEECEVSGPNCDDANGYTWGETTVLWQNDIFVLYGQTGFWPVLHKHEHVLFRPLSAKKGR